MKSRFIALSLIVAGLFSTSCLHEDYSSCYNTYRLLMSYKGDGTAEIFPDKIKRVEMYVFDQTDACVSTKVLSDEEVAARETTLPPLDPGEYRIVCLGNTFDTGLENLMSGDYGKILFAADDYIEGRTVSGNDSLYYASMSYKIEDFDAFFEDEDRTIEFQSSHYDVLVEVVNAPDNIGRHPKIEILGVSPQTDFENIAKGQATDYIMTTVHDGQKTTTARSNIMRHKNHQDVWLKVTGEDGTQVAMINFAEHLERYRNVIDPTKQECLIPFSIRYGTPELPLPTDQITVEITISVPEWLITNITPDFK